MKLIKPSDKEWDDRKGYSKKVFLTEDDLQTAGAKTQLNKVPAGEIAENHYHKKQREIFYFLDGNGYFVVNDERVVVGNGDILVIEPEDRHKVVNNTDQDMIYVAFKIGYEDDDIYWLNK